MTSPTPDSPARTGTPTVAVLGTGVMGAGMVRSLRRAGIVVRAWNRDPAKAQALTGTGAEACDSPADAARGADVLLTMVFDADAAVDVVRQAAPAAGTVWLQTTTVGVEGADRTVEVARELGLVLVDAPVLGTRKPAEEGALVVLASGPEEVRAGLEPVLEAIGARTLWLGEAGAGSRLKLVCNAWVLSLTAAVAQSVSLAEGLGVDPQHFLDAVRGGAADSPYAHAKGAQMIAGDFPVSFSLAGAAKDARLIRSALQASGVTDALTAAVLHAMDGAAAQLPDAAAVDMGAVVRGFRPA
ncbi:NAD-binding protein [Modestobacter sp. I12A-02628]|uniref:NAD(P)-dependent oxidoreductase n=1 Tax=Goekera deserti TaxID=2497753 RepID=A0A7K3WJ58_9ACTN|nr:NAD(P)-dependent oxidoreductase [Goekera deserti]MPQ98200.1 NAD-binding protein [Goekera deserti]NDI48850.1 NAD-binding protein [Goekera deserti]NEL56531.1 NAD(P)-dependent oxidoreductase [Goekera deserti]